MSNLALVVARADNGIIGNRGRIPWRIPEDMRRFRGLTIGKPCIMGRKTWDSLPIKPLPKRLNIVVTRDATFQGPGAELAPSLNAALVRATAEGSKETAVIGGAEIYREALPAASRIYLTEVHGQFDGDVRFPQIDPDDWFESSREDHVTPQGLRYSFVTLERARARPVG